MTRQPPAPDADVAIERSLERWIGLDVSTIGRPAVQRAARTRMATLGIEPPAAYAARLEADEQERDALVEEVVVAESWFFRDPQVFEFVARFATTLAALPGRLPLRILSAPCAGGEEPYSVAMALLEAGLPPGSFTIDAVDVSRAALARATAGRYSANAFRNADLSFRDRWFMSEQGGTQLDGRIRGQVAFARANLLDPGFVSGRQPYDVIFCRNLLIYLGDDARARVEGVLDSLLKPDGVLVLGAAEPPILRGGWIPAGAASVFALRRGSTRQGGKRPSSPPATPRSPSSSARRRVTSSPITPGRPLGDVRAAEASLVANGVAVADAAPAPSTLDDVLARAGQFANAGRYHDALAVCEEARASAVPSPQLFFLMGMLHQAAGDLDRAEGCFHKTLYLDAMHDEALLALALLATQRGDTTMAETYRQSATRVLARKEAT
jgi:chemotaxis protein methyltransferase WspC